MWRRGWDSNPRCFRTPLFESGTINHSDTSPRERIPARVPVSPTGGPCASARGGGEQLLDLVATDAADDLDAALEGGVLRELEHRSGGAIGAIRYRIHERLDVRAEQRPHAHRARLDRREHRDVAKPIPTDAPGRLAERNDDGVGRR